MQCGEISAVFSELLISTELPLFRHEGCVIYHEMGRESVGLTCIQTSWFDACALVARFVVSLECGLFANCWVTVG